MRLFGRKPPDAPIDDRSGPYRGQRIDPPTAPPPRGLSRTVRLAFGAFVLLVAWYFGGFAHLPWRARALCWSSAEPGETFSPTAFRWRARLLALTFLGDDRPHPPEGRESWALGTWTFLRCSCDVFHRDGRVVRKRVHCFD